MNPNAPYTSIVVVSLLWLVLVGCLCGGSGDDDSTVSLPIARDDVDHRLVTDAEANGWYLGSGSFVQLWGQFDVFYLPESGKSGPVDILETHHFGSWDLSSDNLIVAETEDRDPATEDTPHLIVMDLDLNVVWEDPERKHFEIYSDYRWSPDGTMISYAHGNQIFIIDWATKETRSLAADHKPVVRDGPLYATPSWAPDSKRLTYQTAEDEVAVIDVTTRKRTFLGKGEVPAWSPDGTTIACVADEKYPSKKMLAYDVETGEKRELFEAEWTLEGQPVWTPDGKYLLLRRPLVNSIYGELYFFVMAEGKLYSTGKRLAGIRNTQVVALPEAYRSKLALRTNNDTENPNRNPR